MIQLCIHQTYIWFVSLFIAGLRKNHNWNTEKYLTMLNYALRRSCMYGNNHHLYGNNHLNANHFLELQLKPKSCLRGGHRSQSLNCCNFHSGERNVRQKVSERLETERCNFRSGKNNAREKVSERSKTEHWWTFLYNYLTACIQY